MGWLVGLTDDAEIEQLELSLAAPWTGGNHFWIFVAATLLFCGAVWFYVRLQERGSLAMRLGLGAARGRLLDRWIHEPRPSGVSLH